MLLLTLLLYFLLTKNGDKTHSRPEIDLGYATYRGLSLHDGVDQYLGMRFAAPPLGDLRWRAPRDPAVAEGVQDADKFGPICYGTDHMGWDNEDEDCLFVNVWAPRGADETSKLPVWVYIQGGGYTANSNANYDGTTVVRESGQNIVFVNFNYRVGLWGFLADERVREDGDLNAGLLDQRQLLLWVQKHISKFGGDPDHVVIHGVSAGAGSVALHLAAYGGRDDHLFVGASSQSVFFPAHPAVGDLGWQFNRTLERADCAADAGSPMACLRGKGAGALQNAANAAAPFRGRASSPRFYWTPCVDGDLIEDTPSAMFESGRFIRVPLMLGTTTDEGSNFAANAATPGAFTSFMRDNFPGLTDDDADAMLEHYPEADPLPQHESWFPSASAAYGESTFVCPTNLVMDSFAAGGVAGAGASANETWSYRYNVRDAEYEARGRGVEHTFDRAAVLGPDSIGGTAAESYYTYNAPMVPLVMGYYISFVRALDPNLHRQPRAPEWGAWAGGRRMVFQLGASEMETVGEGERDRCEFWGGIAGHMEH